MVSNFDRNTRIGSPSGTATLSSTTDAAERFAARAIEKRTIGDPSCAFEAKAALVLAPESASYWSIFGNLRFEEHEPREAVTPLERVVRINPESHAAFFNLGNSQYALGALETAITLFLRAVCLDPSYAAAYANMGNALRETGDIPRAINAYAHATRLRPGRAETQWNLATALLLSGDFQKGLPSFEWRKKLSEHYHRGTRPNPWLQGDKILGKIVKVYEEQGLGDLIQFARFLPEIKTRGAKSILVCSSRIAQLMRESQLADVVVTEDDDKNEISCQSIITAEIMSLPLLLEFSPSQLPVRKHYLRACPARRRRWQWIRQPEAINVGIAWQGAISAIDRGRSFPLKHFAQIAALPHINLVSLQRNEGRGQLYNAGISNILDLPDTLDHEGAFLDSIAVMSELDLVITSDTSIAHVAGASGAPVWIALQYSPDWRWGMSGQYSAWYPSARLYRQRLRGDWDEVFERITDDLRSFPRSPYNAVDRAAASAV